MVRVARKVRIPVEKFRRDRKFALAAQARIRNLLKVDTRIVSRMVRRLYHCKVGACQGNFRPDDCHGLSSAYAQSGSLTVKSGVVVCWSYHITFFTVVAL